MVNYSIIVCRVPLLDLYGTVGTHTSWYIKQRPQCADSLAGMRNDLDPVVALLPQQLAQGVELVLHLTLLTLVVELDKAQVTDSGKA